MDKEQLNEIAVQVTEQAAVQIDELLAAAGAAFASDTFPDVMAYVARRVATGLDSFASTLESR